MTAGNPAAGSRFRSLGADDSYFETRARATSKEAEQRWPLFKAVAPSQAQETPELGEQQRQTAWDLPLATTTPPQEPRLSRPGLNQKLANGLRKLGLKTKQEIAPPPPTPTPSAARGRNLRSSRPSAEVPMASRQPGASLAAMDAASQPVHATSSELMNSTPSAPQGAMARKKNAHTPHVATTALPRSAETPRLASAKKGLFTQLAPAPEQPRADATPPAITPLQSVFARLNADTAAPEAAAARKRNSLFGRIGR